MHARIDILKSPHTCTCNTTEHRSQANYKPINKYTETLFHQTYTLWMQPIVKLKKKELWQIYNLSFFYGYIEGKMSKYKKFYWIKTQLSEKKERSKIKQISLLKLSTSFLKQACRNQNRNNH